MRTILFCSALLTGLYMYAANLSVETIDGTGETDEFYYLPTNGDYCSSGVFSTNYITIPADEQFIDGEAFDVYNAFETNYRTIAMMVSSYEAISIGGIRVSYLRDRIQGQDNPKTAKIENLFVAMEPPVQGSCYKVVLHEAGYLYVVFKTTPNKAPFVYDVENGYYHGCKFLSISDNTSGGFGNPAGGVCVEYKGDSIYNRLQSPPSLPCEVLGGTYTSNGVGVVYAHLQAGTYLMGSDGSKMMAVGFGFSENEEEVVAYDAYGDSVLLTEPNILYTQECLQITPNESTMPTDINLYTDEGIVPVTSNTYNINIPCRYIAYEQGSCNDILWCGIDLTDPDGNIYKITSYNNNVLNHTILGEYSVIVGNYIFLDLQSYKQGEWHLKLVQQNAGNWKYTNITHLTQTRLSVQVPIGTSECYVASNFSQWEFELMTPINDTLYTYTFHTDRADTLRYKYTAGPSWTYVESAADSTDIDNRLWAERDTVARWKAIPGQAQNDRFYLTGTLNSWNMPGIPFTNNTLTLYLNAGTYNFKITNGSWYGAIMTYLQVDLEHSTTLSTNVEWDIILTLNQSDSVTFSVDNNYVVTIKRESEKTIGMPTDINLYTDEGIVQLESNDLNIDIPCLYLAYERGTSYDSQWCEIRYFDPDGEDYKYNLYEENNPLADYCTIVGDYLFIDLQTYKPGIWHLRQVQQNAGNWKYYSNTRYRTTDFVEPQTIMTVQGTQQLHISLPEAFTASLITWTSSDSTVLTISSTGLVTALSMGGATISATATMADIHLTARIDIEVVEEYSTSDTIYTLSYPLTIEAGKNTTAGHIRFADWVSDIQGKANAVAKRTYPIYMDEGDLLQLHWTVSSESNYDYLTITIDEEQKVRTSGTQAGSLEYVATKDTTVILVVTYSKDGSFNSGDDMATISDIHRQLANPVVLQDVKNMTIRQDSLLAMDVVEPILLDTICYTRTFNTLWEALYLPFEVPASNWNGVMEVARINGFYQYDNDEDGTIDETILEVIRMPHTATLLANYPYLIRASQVEEGTIMLENSWLEPTIENTFDCATFTNRFIFKGTYQEKSAGTISGKFIVQDGMLKPASMTSILPPCSWYMDVENRIGALPNAPMRICVHDEGDPSTDLKWPQMGEQIHKFILNGSLYIQRRGATYNAIGIKMTTN